MSAKRMLSAGISWVMMFASSGLWSQDTAVKHDLKECSARGGIPNFLKALESGKEVRIAYLGGSITAAPGWRVMSLEWLREKYPNAKIEEIFAAIGGTGSELGVFRLENDVLRHKPDLLFVEFAVNDFGVAPDRVKQTMEGIVRKTWREFPECDIVFIYTVASRDLEDIKAGKMPLSASYMEVVAEHYNIPSVHFGALVAELELKGELQFRGELDRAVDRAGGKFNPEGDLPRDKDGKIPFSPDNVHPFIATGHQLYMRALARSLETIIEKGGAPGPHKLDKVLNERNFENAKVFPLDAAEKSGGWSKLPADSELSKRFEKNMPVLWKATPGDSLKFKFKGTGALLYDILGPDCGALEITVDGKSRTARRFDGYCNYFRISTLPLSSNLPDGIHTVEVKVLDDDIDKMSILQEHRRPDMEKNPNKYAGKNWYVGNIFILGEPVE